MPIVNCDILQTRHRDLKRITPQNSTMNVTVEYSPVSLGKLRLVLHVQATMENLKNLGFSDKDVDEVKGIFADTNIYLLGGTLFIAAVHVSTISTDIMRIAKIKRNKREKRRKRKDSANLPCYSCCLISSLLKMMSAFGGRRVIS